MIRLNSRGIVCLCLTLIIALSLVASLFIPLTVAYAGHATAGTMLWANETINGGPGELNQYDIGTDTFVASCVPSPTVDGRGVAHDPMDGNLWYTYVDVPASGYAGDGLIHKAAPPPSCAVLPSIPFGDGPGGSIQDAIGALDADPDDGNLWAAGYQPIGTKSFLYKVDRVSGAILQSCWVPFGGGGEGNDTLAVAQLSGLAGSGKYLLTDAGELTTTPNDLLVVDTASCVGDGPGTIVTSYPKVMGMTGIDFEDGQLIATNLFGPIANLGGPPFGAIGATMSITPAHAIEDITLEAELHRVPTKLVLTPKTADNPAGSNHTVTATVYDQFGAPFPGVTVVFQATCPDASMPSGSDITDAAGQATFTFSCATPGTSSVTAAVDSNANGVLDPDDQPTDKADKRWLDVTPPQVACVETVNPHGQKVPPAGSTTLPGSKGGQNEDGFYQLFAIDDFDPNVQVWVGTASSPMLFGPFSTDLRIKITEAPGATPSIKKIGSSQGAAGAVTWHIILPADAVVTAVDASGNSASTTCFVPPPPK